MHLMNNPYNLDLDLTPYTVLFRPIVHVTVTSEKKLFVFIRLKSKENLSAISE